MVQRLGSSRGTRARPGAGQPSKIASGAHKLAFILLYLKVYPTFDVMSVFSGINAGDCCRWVHNLMPVLEKLLGQKLALPKRKIGSVEEFAAAFPQAVEVITDGTCVGTTFAADNVYYYNRPVSVYASHSYGALLLAGSEFLKAMENPAFIIQHKVRTYYYIPKTK